MALTLAEQNTLAQNGFFISRVRQGMLTVASTVQAEDTTTFNHTARLALARGAIRSPEATAKIAAFTLVTTSALSVTDPEAISDAAYISTITSRWNDLTGESTYQ